MEQKRRNGCLIAILILAAFACCIAAAAAVTLGVLTDWTFDVDWQRPWEFFANLDWRQAWEGGRLTDTEEKTFDGVGDEPLLLVDSFAGTVTILSGEGDSIEVVATKRANTQIRLDGIDVDWKQTELGVEIRIRRGAPGGGSASVDLDIVTPSGTHTELVVGAGDLHVEDILGGIVARTGAGDIDIRGCSGSVDVSAGAGDISIEDHDGELIVHTGAGDVDVAGCEGRAELNSGAGKIDYEGRPADVSSFEAGAGNITLRLPSDADVEIDITTGLGDVQVHGFDGLDVSRQAVTGAIGDASRGSVRAHTGVGDIELYER